MENSVDLDQMPQNAASALALHCLLRPVYHNTQDIYDAYGEQYDNFP